MNRPISTPLLIATGALLGMALAAALPLLATGERPGAAWVFGAGLGLLQSLIGIALYLRSIGRAQLDLMLGLGSGLIRILALLAAFGFAVRAGLPPAAAATSLLTMYLVMLVVEIIVVNRAVQAAPAGCR